MAGEWSDTAMATSMKENSKIISLMGRVSTHGLMAKYTKGSGSMASRKVRVFGRASLATRI